MWMISSSWHRVQPCRNVTRNLQKQAEAIYIECHSQKHCILNATLRSTCFISLCREGYRMQSGSLLLSSVTNSICGRQRLTCRISLCWEWYRMQSGSLLALISHELDMWPTTSHLPHITMLSASLDLKRDLQKQAEAMWPSTHMWRM